MSEITLVDGLPLAKDLKHLLNEEALSRTPSSLKSLYPIASRPGMIALAGGLPRHEIFPFQSYSAEVLDGNGKYSVVTIPALESASKDYTTSKDAPGLNALRSAIKKVVLRGHGPSFSNWDLMVTAGNTASFDNCLRMLCNRGDGVLVEVITLIDLSEWCYSSALEQMKPLGLVPIRVKMDAEGLIPSDIPRAIAEFRKTYGEQPRVTMVYVVPTAQNPTGALMGVERRKDLVRVANELDLIIVEDDPYNAIELPAYQPPESRGEYTYKGAAGLLPTLFSLDTEGRVIYLYTFSKVITPGMRLGFVAASTGLLEILKYFQETSFMFASGFSQGLLLHLFNEWGAEGFDTHAKMIQKHYAIRRDWIIDASIKYLYAAEGYGAPVEYDIPESGMFVWYRIVLNEDHPPFTPKRIYERLIERNVLVAHGDMFNPTNEEVGNAPFLRVSFSFASKENLLTAIKTLGEVSVCFYKFRSAKDYDKAIFDGSGISVFDLKREIIINKKLGKGTDFDLAIFNAQTNEEYTDDSFIIPRNTLILVNRNPASRPGRGTAQRYVNNTMAVPGGDGRGRPAAAPAPVTSLPKHMTLVNNNTQPAKPQGSPAVAPTGDLEGMSENDRIAAMFSAQDSQWQQEQEKMAMQRPVARQWTGGGFRGRGGFNPGGPGRDAQKTGASGGAPGSATGPTGPGGAAGGSAPAAATGTDSSDGGYNKFGFQNYQNRVPKPGYVCYRCGEKGHFIQQCPTIGNKDYDRPKLKKTTGIPKIFLKPVEDKTATGAGVMVNPNGELVRAFANTAAWAKVAPTAPAFGGVGDIYEMADVKPEFECPLCHKNMKDPVYTPCCRTYYCDECIRDCLLEHEDHSKRFKCPKCDSSLTPDQLVSDKEKKEVIETYLRDFASNINRSTSASPIPPHSTLKKDEAQGRSPRGSPNPPDSVQSDSVNVQKTGEGSNERLALPSTSSKPSRPYRIVEPLSSNNPTKANTSSVNPGPGYVQRNSQTNRIPVVAFSEGDEDRRLPPRPNPTRPSGGARGNMYGDFQRFSGMPGMNVNQFDSTIIPNGVYDDEGNFQPFDKEQESEEQSGDQANAGGHPPSYPMMNRMPRMPGPHSAMGPGPSAVPNNMMGRPIHGGIQTANFRGGPGGFGGGNGMMMNPMGFPMGGGGGMNMMMGMNGMMPMGMHPPMMGGGGGMGGGPGMGPHGRRPEIKRKRDVDVIEVGSSAPQRPRAS
ncbi:Aromatic/aminoadipate aminotransferase 1 [Phlyctochytrium bullatum]|nr:Aromatic/aminoadipate aminotransferase 1 [Phlyctochytrium bullatum]